MVSIDFMQEALFGKEYFKLMLQSARVLQWSWLELSERKWLHTELLHQWRHPERVKIPVKQYNGDDY